MRSKLSTTQPSVAVAPPATPVPAPRGTSAVRCRVAHCASACTWVVEAGRATATGQPPGAQRA